MFSFLRRKPKPEPVVLFVPIDGPPLHTPICEAIWDCDCGCGQVVHCTRPAETTVQVKIPDGDAFTYHRRCLIHGDQ